MEVLVDMEVKAALVRKEDPAGKVEPVLIVVVIKADREQAGRAVQVDQQGREDLDPRAGRAAMVETARTLP